MGKGGAQNARYNAQHGDGCFIATATMGNYSHPSVIELRRFRDEFLNVRGWGKSFIQAYYKHSPRVAVVIERHTVLRGLSYIFIVKPLTFISKLLCG